MGRIRAVFCHKSSRWFTTVFTPFCICAVKINLNKKIMYILKIILTIVVFVEVNLKKIMI